MNASSFDPWGAPSTPVTPAPRPSGGSFDPWSDAPRTADGNAASTPGASTLGGQWGPESESGEPPAPRGDGDDILIVCTGNICRSPYIERVLAHHVADLGMTVRSAGTGALVGQAIEPGSVRLLTAAAVDDTNFAARQLEPQMVRDSDLVLTATRYHRRETVRIGRTGLNKTFALLDFADLVQGVGEDEIAAAEGGSAVAKLVRAAELRRPQVQARVEGADIRDPFRLGNEVFVEMQQQSDPAIAVVAEALRRAAAVTR